MAAGTRVKPGQVSRFNKGSQGISAEDLRALESALPPRLLTLVAFREIWLAFDFLFSAG